jgi:hypothetical protein
LLRADEVEDQSMKRTCVAALLFALAIGLGSCGPQGAGRSVQAVAPEASAPAPPPQADTAAADDKAAAPNDQAPNTPAGGTMLAYAYAYGLEVPSGAVAVTMKAHEDACVNAGAALCQVLAASTNAYGAYDIRAHLQVRGEPRWLAGFRAHLESDAQKAGGKITSSNVTTEDLTRQIVDTEAALRAQSTLRDRLQKLLASRPGKLSELLDVERELARVQGEIDATQSNLAVMKTRVTMSVLDIDYTSAGAPVTDTTFAPIKTALETFLRYIAEGVGLMITLVAVIAPWALMIGLVAWLILRARRKRPPAAD